MRAGRTGRAVLVLDDGKVFTGTPFGAVGQTLGEAVFSTGMSGYQETLTDPSYHGQIVVATAPQIGNTGWNGEDAESRGDKIWVAGYAVRDPSPRASNWRATGTLDDELVRQGIVGIAGIDTRAVVRHLRTAGSMKAGVFSGDALAECRRVGRPGAQPAFDAGRRSRRRGQHRGGLRRGSRWPATLHGGRTGSGHQDEYAAELRQPRHSHPRAAVVDDVRADSPRLNPDGVFLSNGPGDPATADHVVAVTREVLGAGIPLFGICFGNQLLGRALGRSTYKMTFGHRGINIPVMDHATGRVAVTAQNHGFALEGEAGEEFDTPFGRAVVSHTCANDGVVEGIKLVNGRAFSVQYHPEAAAGPHDAEYLFDQFVDLMAGDEVDATSRRPQPRAGDRLGADRHRAGLRVRLFGHPGVPRVACRGATGQPDQFESGDDHDRPGVRRQHLRRTDHAGVRGEGVGSTSRARQQDRRRARHARRADRAEHRGRRCTIWASWRSTTSNSSAPTSRPSSAARTARSSRTSSPRSVVSRRSRGCASPWTRSARPSRNSGCPSSCGRHSPWVGSGRAWRTRPTTSTGWLATGWPRRRARTC